MAEVGRVSIRLPSSIKQGDVIRVRTLVIHPMEIVQRDKANKIIPKNYLFIHSMTVAYNGKEMMRTELTQGCQSESEFYLSVESRQAGQADGEFFGYRG